MSRFYTLIFLSILVVFSGCGFDTQVNPSFPVGVKEAKNVLNDLRSAPVKTDRPIIVLAGYQDPGLGSSSVARKIRRNFVDPENIISISYFISASFDKCSTKVIEEVENAFLSQSPDETVEVDVVGISMGGLVARHAARSINNNKRLKIKRLFTISTPHQGAKLADLPTLDQRQIDMREGSDFLVELNEDESSRDFEIIAYGRLGDGIVGVENVAPPGMQPWWVPNRSFHFSHLTSANDPRILADIISRLRGETPLTIGEPVAPPED